MGLRQRTHFVRCGRRHFSSQIEIKFRFGLRVKVVLLCSTKTRIKTYCQPSLCYRIPLKQGLRQASFNYSIVTINCYLPLKQGLRLIVRLPLFVLLKLQFPLKQGF